MESTFSTPKLYNTSYRKRRDFVSRETDGSTTVIPPPPPSKLYGRNIRVHSADPFYMENKLIHWIRTPSINTGCAYPKIYTNSKRKRVLTAQEHPPNTHTFPYISTFVVHDARLLATTLRASLSNSTLNKHSCNLHGTHSHQPPFK